MNQLHQSALMWDNHVCMPLRPDDTGFLPQIERHRAAGADMVVINAGFGNMPLSLHLEMLESFRQWFGTRADQYALIKTADDILDAKAAGKLAVAFDIEGMEVLGDDLSLIETFHDLGVKWMLIAYNEQNKVGSGCHVEDHGLSDFGCEVIREMERVGMVLCCSHTGYRTALEAIEFSNNPVILSHSNPRALHNHPRNVPDEVMVAIANSGGVMGINGIGAFLGDSEATTSSVLRHIDYAVNLIGHEHVGLGIDYVFDMEELDDFLRDNAETFPAQWGYKPGMQIVQPEQLSEITDGLQDMGYTDGAIRAILGENWMRVARQVWK
jgi:membrane dipeptidase